MICIPTNDEEYHQWLESNEGGYVVNSDKSLKALTLPMLHRAVCDHINDVNTPNYTTAHLKICSTKQEDLEFWLRLYDERELKLCKSCAP